MTEATAGSTLLEIAELANGDIVLQRVDGEGVPLVRIRFSAESRAYLADARLGVARAMIEAGIRAAAHQLDSEARVEDAQESADQGSGPVLH